MKLRRIKLNRKTIVIVSVLLLLVAVATPVFLKTQSASAWECKARNVVTCGVNTKTELVNAIDANPTLEQNFDAIGIYRDDIMSVETVAGFVRKDGSVWVNGNQVATGTVMGQRGTEDIENVNTAWAGLNWALTFHMFEGSGLEQQPAYVYMREGTFMYAIVTSCGNPVLRSLYAFSPDLTLVKDVRNITDNPSGEFVNSIDADPGDRVEYRVELYNNSHVTAEKVAVWDTLPNYLTLDDANARVMEWSGSAWQEQTLPFTDAQVASGREIGNFLPEENGFLYLTATVDENVPEGCTTLVNTGYADSAQTPVITDTANVRVCRATPPTPPTPTPTPTPTPVTPTTLPVSGPIAATAGIFGTAGLGYSGYYWLRSKKALMKALKKD